MTLFQKLFVVTGIVLSGFIAGCGGGGGGSAGSTSMNLFASDDLNQGYDHVWVTIKKVVLKSNDKSQTIYDDPVGRTVDLHTLHDSNGARFTLLGAGSIPAGTYNGADITLAKDVVIYPTGATTGTKAAFENNDGTNKLITMNFGTPKVVTTGTNLVLDFDLAKWNLVGNVVSASGEYVKQGDGVGLSDKTKHEDSSHPGIIAGLTGTAPTQTFKLGLLTVNTDEHTSIFNNDGSDTPVLANGETVEVRGVFDATTNSLLASTIRLKKVVEQNHNVKAEGLIATLSSPSMTVTIKSAEKYQPTTITGTVNTDSNTQFFSKSGVSLTQSAFFALATVGDTVDVEGTLDVSSQTLTAVRVKLESEHSVGGGDGGEDHHQLAHVFGTLSTSDLSGNTVTIKATGWAGMSISLGKSITVVMQEDAAYHNGDGNITESAFFGLLSVDLKIAVEGEYDPSTGIFTAKSIRIVRP